MFINLNDEAHRISLLSRNIPIRSFLIHGRMDKPS